MPRQSKGPRLFLRSERKVQRGKAKPSWVVLDTVAGKQLEKSTGCGEDDRNGAEKALLHYITHKHFKESVINNRDPRVIPVADVLALYLTDKVPGHANPIGSLDRINRLLNWWGDKLLIDVNGSSCLAYSRQRSGNGAARRELEEMRAAIFYHRKQGLCSEIIEVSLPPAGAPRERWLTRSEVAKLVWTAWRYREIQNGKPTDRRSRQHVARFILAGVYTGTRSGAICEASFAQQLNRGLVDTEGGIFYRRPSGHAETKKKRPSIRLPDAFLAHARRWKRNGAKHLIEWNGMDSPSKTSTRPSVRS